MTVHAPHVPQDAGDGASAAWHGGWALAVAALAALALILGAASGVLLAALAAGAAPGALGALWRPADRGSKGVLLCVWGAGAVLAVLLTGGIGGPLGLWLVAPLLAALVLGGPWSVGAGAAFAALAGVGVVQAGGGAAAALASGLALPLTLAAAALALGFGAAALMLREGLPSPSAPLAAPVAAQETPMGARVAEAEAARDRAQAEARAKMRLIANVSHELRTPLNAIMGFSDIMRSKLFGELSPRYTEYAELIHESGAHLLDLIGDVLDVSKIEADKYVLAREDFDVREAVGAALRILRQQADEAGVALRGVLPPEPLDVDADRRAIKQIVLNLAANALKFTPAGGSVTVTARAAAGALELVVADTGVGIAPEDLERLGRPYEQAGDAADRARGTGLGLTLVKAFAGLHGGELLVESRLGEGTAATVRLPVLDRGGATPER